MIPVPELIDNAPVGSYEIWVYPYGAASQQAAFNATFVREAPTMIGSMQTQDPFGPAAADLTFPAVTMLDAIGSDDLWWLLPEADVDIVFIPATSDDVAYRWEGYMTSFAFTPTDAGSSLTVSCLGAGRQVDNYLAKPEYVYQPIPYEIAIARQFEGHPDLRLAPLKVEWPTWWDTVFTLADYAAKPLYLRPIGLTDGQPWSGMVTRATGSFEQALTGYIQGLLANMYSEYGQWTVDIDEGRQPVLRHRTRKAAPDATTLVVDILTPGIRVTPTKDFSQRLNVVYGQGKALNGSTFSGMRSSADGARIYYEPMAFRRSVHPLEQNDWYDRSIMRKEVSLSFYEGLAESEAQVIARKHLQRFADPGVTGTIELKSDPWMGSGYFSRRLIRAGMSIQVMGLFGSPDGVLFHITDCTVTADSTSLTVDSKFRDQLTVSEVRMRTRDALAPVRMLTLGAYKPAIPDMLFPWSYADGSGFVPKTSTPIFSAGEVQIAEVSIFGGLQNVGFPWEDLTTKRPPSDPAWTDCYIHIPPASANADENWANSHSGLADFKAFPVRMSQAGEARLVQFAAFDKDGHVLKVPFHVSFYRTNGVSYSSMPMMGIDDEAANPPYLAGQHYPFFRRAWESIDEQGVTLNPETGRVVPSAQVLAGWGNFFEKAGYWPTTSLAPGAQPTGLFTDETGFSWDLTDAVYGVDPQRSPQENAQDPNRADIWCMVYCDAQLTQDVYFLGRIWRKGPGTA
jgi:hypothetical protein